MAYKYKLVQEISKDPLGAKIQDLKKRFEEEDEEMGEPKPDPKAKNTLKKQGKANLAQEVLRRLKNR